MKKVEPSGVVLKGICSIQTDRCRAKKGAPLPPCGGHLVGRRSMSAGRVWKKRFALASGRLMELDCCSTPERPCLTGAYPDSVRL